MIEYFQISSGNWYFLLVIVILLYFLINWFIGKFLQKNTLRKAISLVSAIFLTPAVYYVIVALFFSILFYEYHPEIKFNSTEWTENKSERHHMKKDLIESEILIGKSKSEIVEILGIPENKIKVELDTIKNWNYYMGSEGHGMGWKFHSLDLYFEKGSVESVELAEFID